MTDDTQTADEPGLFEADITSLPKVHRGKVRDIFEIDAAHWLIVATDRVSAFDVILPTTIPGKGRLLTQIALLWFQRFRPMIANHLADLSLDEVLPDPVERAQAAGRSMIVRRLNPLPVEAVVRGYLAGSGWKDYRASGEICGIGLPEGLRLADRLPRPLFTPATKAAMGDHDENIDASRLVDLIGREMADDIQRVSHAIYRDAAGFAEDRGLILADTKFEFGTDAAGRLVLMDEILTPDSSRYWDRESWSPGTSPPSYDKQYVRDWLETQDWDKTAPGPALPPDVVGGTVARYREALRRLT